MRRILSIIVFCFLSVGLYAAHGWDEEVADSDTTATESKLVFPNAFSPNGDGYNDFYKAKEAENIVQFHAIIFNRWGQRLYAWDNADEGWDGTFNGKPVKDGVYFVYVKAKGSDGHQYEIRKDVNLMRGYIDSDTTSP